MGCSPLISIGPPSWRQPDGIPSTPQSHGQETGAHAALTASRCALPEEGLPAYTSSAGRRACSPRQAVTRITDRCGISGLLRDHLAGATADACGDAQAAPLHGDPQCRTGAAPRHGCGSADLSRPHHAGQGTQRSVCAISLRLSGGTRPIPGRSAATKRHLFVRIQPVPPVLNSAAATDCQGVCHGRGDYQARLSASVSSSTHHVSDEARYYQPQTAITQWSYGRAESSGISRTVLVGCGSRV